jgi:ATP-dependent Zn protease
MTSIRKALCSGAIILSLAIWILGCTRWTRTSSNQREITYSELYEKVTRGEVQDVVIEGNELTGHLKSSPNVQIHATVPANFEDLEKAMLAAGVNFTIKSAPVLSPRLLNLGPFFVLGAVWLLTVPPYWAIFKKAGFQQILSIVMLVPLANLIMLYIVAFSRWKSDPPRDGNSQSD